MSTTNFITFDGIFRKLNPYNKIVGFQKEEEEEKNATDTKWVEIEGVDTLNPSLLISNMEAIRALGLNVKPEAYIRYQKARALFSILFIRVDTHIFRLVFIFPVSAPRSRPRKWTSSNPMSLIAISTILARSE